jgi:hypothetical protein
MARSRTVAMIAVGLSLAAPRGARAQGEDSRPAPAPLALRAELGEVTGAAVGAELRAGPVVARATGGAALVFLLIGDPDTHEIDSVEAYGALQLNGELLLFPIRLATGTEIGFSLAAHYSGLLGAGGGLRVEVRRQLRERLGLTVSGGIAVFPDAEERIVERKDVPPDADLNYPLGAGFRLGAAVGLTYDLL